MRIDPSGQAMLTAMIRIIRNKRGVDKRKFRVTTKSILKAAVEAQRLGGMILDSVNQLYTLVQEGMSRMSDHPPEPSIGGRTSSLKG